MKDTTEENFVLNALGENVLLVVKINLEEDRCVVLRKADDFTPADFHAVSFSERIQQLVQEKWIHPLEGQRFLHAFDLQRLKNVFYGHADDEANYFKKLYCGTYVMTSIHMYSTCDCSSEHPWILAIVKKADMSLHINYLQNAEYYYSRDPLTGLWNRMKFEKDINGQSIKAKRRVTCIYIDVVGLHELNNHLGHKAGDQMLCTVADALRKYFSSDFIYRIGGDEFVIFCVDVRYSTFADTIAALKTMLRRYNYEISVGVAEAAGRDIRDAMDEAEESMRRDKAAFYAGKGDRRQIRMMNVKLENMLLEKQDASEFLSIISARYKGVYIVNMKTDRCRYIYIPPYFQKILDKNQNAYLPSIREYTEKLVRSEYVKPFDAVCDYAFIRKELSSGRQIAITYQKKEGDWVRLCIFPCYQEDKSIHTTIWIFSKFKQEDETNTQ